MTLLFELALLEYRSALYRKLRNHEITRAAFDVADLGFQQELARL